MNNTSVCILFQLSSVVILTLFLLHVGYVYQVMQCSFSIKLKQDTYGSTAADKITLPISGDCKECEKIWRLGLYLFLCTARGTFNIIALTSPVRADMHVSEPAAQQLRRGRCEMPAAANTLNQIFIVSCCISALSQSTSSSSPWHLFPNCSFRDRNDRFAAQPMNRCHFVMLISASAAG